MTALRRARTVRARPTWSRRSATLPRSVVIGWPPTHRWSDSVRPARSCALPWSATSAPRWWSWRSTRAGPTAPASTAARCRVPAMCSACCARCCSRPRTWRIVKGDPTERRAYLDDLLVARAPRYASVRADYDRVLKQRNALLKSAGATRGQPDLRTLEAWDNQLARIGAELLAARIELVAALRAAGRQGIRRSRAVAVARPRWITAARWETTRRCHRTADVLAAALLAQMSVLRRQELDRGISLVGPHRDDLLLRLGPLPTQVVTPATVSPGPTRSRCGWPRTTCCAGRGASRCSSSTTCSLSSTPTDENASPSWSPPQSRSSSPPRWPLTCRSSSLARGTTWPKGRCAVSDEPSIDANTRESGIDVARALLAQARSRARERGLRPGSAAPQTAQGKRDEARARAAARRATQERSGARPDGRDPQLLGSAIEGLISDRGWEAPAAGAAAVGALGGDRRHPGRRALSRGGLRGRNPHGGRRLDGLGDAGAAAVAADPASAR